MANDLEKKIIRQIEYYFGDINLPRDKFMQEKLKEDEGWIALDVLLTFKRLANLSSDPEVIAEAVKKSDSQLVNVSEDKKKLRRSPDFPLPELNEERRKELTSRTAYAKGFPLDLELDVIISFLEPHGPIESCTRRTYLDKASKEHKFKGSCYIIFKDVETCKKFIEAESVKYNDKELIRKWQADYLEEKKQEFEDRKKNKNEKKQKAELEKTEKKLEFPKGAVIYFTGIKEGQSLTREEIKEKINSSDVEVEVSYIDFNKGDLEGHIRFSAENAGHDYHKSLTEGKLDIGEINLTMKVLEGEEEEAFLKKSIESISKQRMKSKQQGRANRKRKGNFGQGGPKSKHNK